MIAYLSIRIFNEFYSKKKKKKKKKKIYMYIYIYIINNINKFISK